MVLVDVHFSNGTVRIDISQAAIDFYKKQGVRVELVDTSTLPPPSKVGGVGQMTIQIDELRFQQAGTNPHFFFIDITMGTVLPNAIEIGKSAEVVVEVRDSINQQVFIKQSTFTVPPLNASKEQQFTGSIPNDVFNIRGTVIILNAQGAAIARSKTFEAQIGVTPPPDAPPSPPSLAPNIFDKGIVALLAVAALMPRGKKR